MTRVARNGTSTSSRTRIPYAVVYHQSKRIYLGLYGSPESHTAYARFVAESRANFIPHLPKEGSCATVSELAAAFLDHAEVTVAPTSYAHYRILIGDFLLKLYGDGTPVDDFKPRCLKLVRSALI